MKKLIRYIIYGVGIKWQNTSLFVNSAYSKAIFNLRGVSIGHGCKFFGKTFTKFHPDSIINIGSNCTFRSSFSSNTIGLKQKCFLSAGRGAYLFIGDDCGLSGTVISAEKSIIIGERVFCGANVTICDSDRHPIDSILRAKGGKGDVAPVCIENDVWIGMNSVVLKGVSIGKGTVIGANSVVNKDIPANVIAAGVPAKVIRNIEDMSDNDNL
ncbi:MAG: acyltransferase [Colwellia sp.]|nr:acyltransferase [Colwellia sp.]